MRPCPNCERPLDGPFCAQCGQRSDVDPRSLKAWVSEALGEVLSLDGALARSLRALVTRPGLLTVEWREGRRARWTAPFRLYLLASLVFFTATVLFPTGATFTVGSQPPDDPSLRGALQSAQEAALASVAPQVLILIVPLLALLLRAAFRSERRVFVEHVVHAVHLQSFLFLLLLVGFAAQFSVWSLAVSLLAILVGFWLHVAASARRVYGVGAFHATTAAAGLLIAYFGITMFCLAFAVKAVERDPLEAVAEVEESYWVVVQRHLDGDSTAVVRAAPRVVVDFMRLEAHFFDADRRAHTADLLLLADSVVGASEMARAGLVSSPEEPLLLDVAARAARALGDEGSARAFDRRLLEAPDPDEADERHRSAIERARQRARRVLDPGGA